MTETATLLTTDMSHWPPATRHYRTSGGRHLAVIVDAGLSPEMASVIDEAMAANELPAVASGKHRILVNDTVIVECTELGEPITLDAVHTFPPGTWHDAAVTQAGYVLA